MPSQRISVVAKPQPGTSGKILQLPVCELAPQAPKNKFCSWPVSRCPAGQEPSGQRSFLRAREIFQFELSVTGATHPPDGAQQTPQRHPIYMGHQARS